MKPTKITVTYGEKSTGNYQAADYSMSVEIELEEKDDVEAIRKDWTDYLIDHVTTVTETEIKRLIEKANGGRR